MLEVARLRTVAEEAVHTLLGDGESGGERDLLLVARADGHSADLEFIAAGADVNLDDQLAMLSEGVTDLPNGAETPLRKLLGNTGGCFVWIGVPQGCWTPPSLKMRLA